MALALALAITLFVAVTCALFALHPWWFPPAISPGALAIDRQFDVTFILCCALFILAQVTLAWFIWRYRSGRPEPETTTERASGARLGRAWAVFVALLFLGLGAAGYRVWASAAAPEAAPPAKLRVEVWGEQFAWYFHYPGPDGQCGPVHPQLMNDGVGNYLGLDRKHDPASRDDIVTATLAVPAGEPVELVVRSKDVIHSFFVRELRIKQDAIPGDAGAIHFTADREGRYEVICSELCGLGHYKMHADLEVMSRDRFQAWLLEQSRQQ